MNARPITPQPADDKETLSQLIDLMGKIDGGMNSEEFETLKQQMMNSGMTTEDLFNILGNNFAEAVIKRPIVDVPIQKLTLTATVPTYSHLADACADIYADEDYWIQPNETHAISTGIALAIPDGYVCHVYARSGLSLKTGLRLANSVGIIDAGYRDELKVPMWNTGAEPFHIEKGMRVAQMNIMPSPAMEFYKVDNVKDYGEDREGGFGSTGGASVLDKLLEEENEQI